MPPVQANSPLIARTGDVPPMPPGAGLPAAVVADFRRWVAMGAPDPRGDAAPPFSS